MQSRTYSIGEVAELLGVSVDTVRRLADIRALRALRKPGGHRRFAAPALARYIAARRAAAPRVDTSRQSARNRFPGIVTRVIKDTVAAQVEVQAGPHRVVSLLTREAVDELRLEPGAKVIASVKATNVVIDLA